MAYGGVQMFMEKLNQLINCNDHPLFNNPEIMCERPQLQLLYDELASIFQTLFIHQHHHQDHLKKLNDLKRRFTYAAEEAQYIVDLFQSGVLTSENIKRSKFRHLFLYHFRRKENIPTSEHFKLPLNLDDVRKSFKSIDVEFMSMRTDNMKMDSSRRTERTLNQSASAQSSNSRNSLGSKKLLDEIVVGLDHDAELIRDKLVEDQKKLDVVSIVGMGGIGKTTLATKVFNDGYVKHHFYVRVWVTVSQTYDKRGMLTQILESMGVKLDLEESTDSKLREMVHKHLMGRRYLIVIDDIWHIKTWDNLKLFFPHDNTGSRILLTSRLNEVAKHANSDGLIHHLGYLNKEKSLELLCQKVFHGNKCPEWSIEPGMQIVENCQGLPLALVVIAGVLAKDAWSQNLWSQIAERTGSYIVGEQNGCLETLGLSYNHLPPHLRECFLYLGGFPEDYKFQVRRMIWLWVAEGFIQQDGNRSFEDIAEGYLADLIDRNLVIISDRRKSDGSIKACILHDLVRELCLIKAKEEQFILKIDKSLSSHNNVITPPHKPVRMFINENINIPHYPYPSAQNLRSILLSSFPPTNFYSFVLLRVLDLQKCELHQFPKGMESLVHLRYLEIWMSSEGFPSSICNLWNLQTLIYITEGSITIDLPSNISDLVNLRHLWSYYPHRKSIGRPFYLHSIEKPMNLQTISGVKLGNGVDNFQMCFPCIKDLACTTSSAKENDFKSLTYLEKLKLNSVNRRMNNITFPATLKTLALVGCGLPWSAMSIIQSLPNLEVLKLKYDAFEGSCWNTDEQFFRQLKFLRLDTLNFKQWEAYSPSFPCLRQLEIMWCWYLEEIPLGIGDIPTLELIKIKKCRRSVGDSVGKIQEEQHDFGNYSLKIDISDHLSL